MNVMTPGRACPLAYRYHPVVLARPPELSADTLYIAGGLYGNEQALATIGEMHAAEAGAVLVFNGDFNWFNAEAAAFERINRAVLAHRAIRGNVETELTTPDDTAGCGCAYPHWVSDLEVERSNAIMRRLRSVAQGRRDICSRLSALPLHLVAEVGGLRIAIVHGDLESLAGWDLAQEHAGDDDRCRRIGRQMRHADVRIVASSHTCLPVAWPITIAGQPGVVINNGAAGMPNFQGERYGVVTRVSVRPSQRIAPLYALRADHVHVEALAVRYDHDRFLASFERCWTPASPAHRSYHGRIVAGPSYTIAQALRRRASPALIEGD